MKKIFAILTSLLFVVSVFGVAQTMAQGTCNCKTEYYKISRDSVHVGETFTISLSKEAWLHCKDIKIEGESIEDLKIITEFPYRIGPVDIIGISIPDEGWRTLTFRAVSPGTLAFTNYAESNGDGNGVTGYLCEDNETITILPKSLPIDWIMKKLGLGKYKK